MLDDYCNYQVLCNTLALLESFEREISSSHESIVQEMKEKAKASGGEIDCDFISISYVRYRLMVNVSSSYIFHRPSILREGLIQTYSRLFVRF